MVLLFLPVNLAKHFFFDFAYVDGILVDYLIPTVYLTDVLIWGLLGFWVFREVKGFSFRKLRFTILDRRSLASSDNLRFAVLFFFILVSGLLILSAQNQPAAVYKWLKLVEYIFFAFYVSKHVDLKRDVFTIVKTLSIGVLFQSVLAILQWFKQGSVFGYWFLGENEYTVSTSGIAVFDFLGSKKVRSYGTFPHPNVLGGYLAVVLPWVFYKGIKEIKEVKEKRFYFLTFALGMAALFLSFSRSAWVVGGLGVFSLFFISSSPHLITPSFLTSLSFLRRAELNWIALEMFKDHPLFGVGLNNFTVVMGEYGKVSGWIRFLQPVHNVYLLIAAETGLLGLAAFLLLLITSYHLLVTKAQRLGTLRPLLLISLTQIVLLCFVDHYFWTLQQTSLLLWLLIGFVFSTKKE